MRRFLLAAAVLLVALSAAVPAAHAAKKQRILLQWTEGDSLGQFIMTKHVGNLLDDLGQDNVQLEVIAYGLATLAVTKGPTTKFGPDIEKLTQRGVTFHVCQHAMDFFGVKQSDLLPVVTPVKGAMWYIATKWAEGWETLRP